MKSTTDRTQKRQNFLQKWKEEEIKQLAFEIRNKFRDAPKNIPFRYKLSALPLYTRISEKIKEFLEKIILSTEIKIIRDDKFIVFELSATGPVSAEECRNSLIFAAREIEKKADTLSSGVPKMPFLSKLPAGSVLNRPILRSSFIDKIQQNLSLLATMIFYVHQFVWLNKISETTTGLVQKNPSDEIHFFLIDLFFPPAEDHDRTIRKINFHYRWYLPEVKFTKESELIKAFDKLIPYQVIFIVRIPYSEEPLYQIWYGQKKVLMKGITVGEYVHSDWLYEKEVPAFSIEGKNYSEIKNNLIEQIKNAKEPDTHKNEVEINAHKLYKILHPDLAEQMIKAKRRWK